MNGDLNRDSEIENVDFVEVLFADVSGVRRCRTFTAKQVPGLLQHGFGLVKIVYFLPPHVDAGPPGGKYTATGEFRIKPDPATFRKIPWRRNAGVALGDAFTETGEPSEESPRHILMRAVSMLKTEFGYDMKIGFETEFVFFSKERDPNGMPAAATAYLYGSQNDNTVMAEVMEDIVTALDDLGIEVVHFHPESAHGQYEISTGPADPVTACDQALLTRFAIVAIAHKHGFEVSFLPKLFNSSCGNGNHVHMSLSRDGVDVSQGTEPKTGLLKHHAAWMIWTAGTPNSFRRYQPCFWSSAYTAWGINNREALVRVLFPCKGMESGVHYEVRCFDYTVNPYVGIAAMILAGILGLRASSPLPPGTEIDPHLLTEEEREERGMRGYPTTVHDAVDQFNANKEFRDLLVQVSSEDYVTSVLATRKCLAAEFAHSDPDAEIKCLYNKY